MSEDVQPGFFGKVPALGDFVQRRVARDFVDPWDGWLQQAVAASKSQLGEGWLQTYLSSPLWRFVLGPNVCGEAAWAGVLMPSVDRVGRYFPLTLAVALPDGARPFSLLRASAWFEGAEDLALSALEEQGFSLDDFSDSVAALGAPDAVLGAGAGDIAGLGAGWHIGLGSVAQADEALYPLLDQLTADRFVASCLWWTDGSDHVAPCLLFSPGLPEPDSFTGLLDGRFADWSWTPLAAQSPAADASLGELLESQ